MRSLYSEKEAEAFCRRYPGYPRDLALRVYTSRLIGRDSRLVLHGGGNTSVKIRSEDLLGGPEEVLFVKGSGRDLASIEPEGFTGLRLAPLIKLKRLQSLSDREMERQLRINRLDDETPDPSVEALLHAFLPHKYIDHAHAESILVLGSQKEATEIFKEILGPGIDVIPYVMSGFPLAKAASKQYERQPDIEGMVVLNHGIFTFAEEARSSYERMIVCVEKAERYIRQRLEGKRLFLLPLREHFLKDRDYAAARVVQVLRGACAHKDSEGRLCRFYTEIRADDAMVSASVSREAAEICESAVLTPDYVIHTKSRIAYIREVPSSDKELKAIAEAAVRSFKEAYLAYLGRGGRGEMVLPDPYPRLFLVSGLGLVAVGQTRKEARRAADIGEHTIRAKIRAISLGGHVRIPESQILEIEIWPLQQKKLRRALNDPLQGQVAVITGAAGAMGFGIADRLLAAGAVVVISDIDRKALEKVRRILSEKHGGERLETIVFDVTDYKAVEKAFAEISLRVGGIDLLVPNAGTAHVAKIEDLDPEVFLRVVAVNLIGTFHVIKASIPVFKRQATGGNIVVVSSKNVFDPGAAFGAYSASKAGAHQLSKIAALELAELGVRVNMINPDAVFGDREVPSRLWDTVGAERMKSRGLDPSALKEYYRQRSLLKVEVRAEHVGNAVVFFASDMTPTTGATLPVDGGIPSAFPR